uniref:PIN domain-containing protein n=1 Tax=Clastoptera arizonana TaxID=38151 RepID=A0A1B6E5F8_9HEMI
MLSDKAVRHAARRANEFINRVISESHPKIIGQPATEAKNSLSENLNLDKYHDSLINCCLQLKTRKRNVVLLAGDPFLHSIASDFSVDVQYKTSFQKEMINLSCLYKLYLSDNLGLNANIKVLSNKSGLHEIRPLPTEEKTESKDITLLSYDCLFSFYIRTSNKICYDIIRDNNLDGGIHLDQIYEFNELKECTSSILSGLQGYVNKDTTTVERSYLYRFQRAIEKIKRLNFVKQFNNQKLGTVPPFKLKDSEEYLSQTSSEILSKHLREFETIYERQEKVSEEIGTKLNI